MCAAPYLYNWPTLIYSTLNEFVRSHMTLSAWVWVSGLCKRSSDIYYFLASLWKSRYNGGECVITSSCCCPWSPLHRGGTVVSTTRSSTDLPVHRYLTYSIVLSPASVHCTSRHICKVIHTSLRQQNVNRSSTFYGVEQSAVCSARENLSLNMF